MQKKSEEIAISVPTGIKSRRTFKSDSPMYDSDSPIESPTGELVGSHGSSDSVSMATLEVFAELPEVIRRDPSMANFRRGYEKRIRKQNTYQHVVDEDESTNNVPMEERPILGSKNHPQYQSMALLSDNGEWFPERSEAEESGPSPEPSTKCSWPRYLKLGVLTIVWMTVTLILCLKSERETQAHQIAIPPNRFSTYTIVGKQTMEQVRLTVQGAFLPDYHANLSSNHLLIRVQLFENLTDTTNTTSSNSTKQQEDSETMRIFELNSWRIPVVSEDLVGIVPEVTKSRIFEMDRDIDKSELDRMVITLRLSTDLSDSFPLALVYDLSPIDKDTGFYFALGLLIGLYLLIITEVIHRTLAAVLASTTSVAILALMDERPSMDELISWINMETLILLFSMMVMVAILSETGVFDYMAVLAYKMTSGKVWPLIYVLCFFTATVSCFLDNVTTIMLLTPTTIRLCEVMELNPVPILMCLVIFSNIGGAVTPVGDPPNSIIASNEDIIASGVNFGSFIIHMGVGISLVMVTTYVTLRWCTFRHTASLRFTEPQDVQDLRHEITVWKHAASSLSSYSKDEAVVRGTLLKKVCRLQGDLKRKLKSGTVEIDNYKATLEELQEKYPIRDFALLVKSVVALLVVISLFLLQATTIPVELSLGWTALLGAILLLLLADNEDMEGVLARVEWSTLLFFAALFILMGALTELGLIDMIGHWTESWVLWFGETYRLAVAILLILWVSAIVSAFVDNIPLTTMMVRIVTSLAHNPELGLPLQPLVWALAFGACLGGNGTLIGSSANLVCAGVAEQHGYRFTFLQYFKIGCPVTIVSVTVSSVYLLISHVILAWH